MIRRIDPFWEIRKYDGDIGLYAHCKCGFEYCCSQKESDSFKQKITNIYRYCPNCGARKKKMSVKPKMCGRRI